jgi:hypothetical protein
MTQASSPTPLSDAIAALVAMDRDDLIGAWRATFGAPPPKRLSALFLRRFIAFELQARQHGGLPKGFERQLATANKTRTTHTTSLKPAGRLLREWNGTTHVVDVMEDGFRWQGERYRSLSAIARAITGARWSGPRFFGLVEGILMAKPKIRCAIYTRKSSDEGLDQAFNSLDAQHEACAAYIASQRHEGWVPIRTRFDDGGVSGGTLDRPALQALLAEIDAGRIGMVVVYKIDRLTRSLSDFAKLVDRFDAAGCSFVSVTQAFNTSSSMGRLTLNVLLVFRPVRTRGHSRTDPGQDRRLQEEGPLDGRDPTARL